MKVNLGAKNCLYPMPTTLVGAMVDGKPNFITIAHVGIMDPGTISLGMGKSHYTNRGIKEHGVFSVNIPSVEMVEVTDHCGLVSGKRADKSQLFEVFYGELEAAPMIQACPVNMACRLIQTVDFPRHDVFIGEVVEAHCDEACLTDGRVDFVQVQPILFTMGDKGYWKLGERFARAWQVGRAFGGDGA